MREIKFRAWHKKRKKYYKVLHLHLENHMNEGIWATCEGYSITEQKEIHIQIQPIDCIIERFTGLKDKNGVEIYEGDILDSITGRPLLVKQSEEYSGFALSYKNEMEMALYKNYANKSVILGSIHEKPELLK